MFDEFDPSLLQSPEFKEDSVREVIVLPLLRRLGYKASGPDRIVRSKTLMHPFIFIGTKKHPVNIIPDYLLLHDDKPILVLDAKSPNEDILKSSHIQQAYSYSIHPEVRSKHFALCNGRSLAVFNVEQDKPLLVLPFEQFQVRWSEIEKFLAPRFLLQPEMRRFAPDFGCKLLHIGIEPSTDLILLGVRLGLFVRLNESQLTATANYEFNGEDHCASFDFSHDLLPNIVAGIPKQLQESFIEALRQAPYQASADLAIEIDISARLSVKIEGVYESFMPLVVQNILESRFNPTPLINEPDDIPPYVFRLRNAFRIRQH